MFARILGLVLLAALLAPALSTVQARSFRNLTAASLEIEQQLRQVLLQFDVSASAQRDQYEQLVFRDNTQWTYRFHEIVLERELDFLAFERELLGRLEPVGVRIHSRESGEWKGEAYYRFRLSLPGSIITHSVRFVLPRHQFRAGYTEGVPHADLPGTPAWSLPVIPQLSEDESGVLVVILDDAGFDFDLARRAIEASSGLVLSVLPNRPDSAKLVRYLRRRQLEFMLHQPMQPVDARAHNPGWGTLRVDMSPAQVDETFYLSMDAIQGAVGMNNHMGSLFTQRADLLKPVMRRLKEASMFFVDSYTHADSRALEVARAAGVPALARDVFLDNEDDPQKIATQLRKSVQLASERGYAIAIGHVRPQTIEVLRKQLPQLLARSSVRLISLTELFDRVPNADSLEAS